jgi:hypothetical protein
MVTYTDSELEAIASHILDVELPTSEEELEKSFRELTQEKHPDAGGSVDEFKSIDRAQDILSPGVGLSDIEKENTSELFRDVLGESKVKEIISDVSQSGVTEQETTSAGDMVNDFAETFQSGATDETKSEVQATSINIKTMLVYESLQQLLDDGYSLWEAQRDAMLFAIEKSNVSIDSISDIQQDPPPKPTLDDYYTIFGDNIIEGIGKEEYRNAAQKIEDRFNDQYGDDVGINRVCNIISQLVVSGLIDMSSLSGFRGKEGGRFSRGSDRFGGGSDKFGARFDRGDDRF